jgi:peptidoglycan/xylan/chitin deacetylase (PgdA/CDA1 family)
MRILLPLALSGILFPAFAQNAAQKSAEYVAGGIIRADRTQKDIHLVFTGHEFGDGGETIRGVLKKHSIKASFFLTGDFYRNPRYMNLIAALKKDGHYLGAHSDKHVLYCSWEKRDSSLVTKGDYFRDVLHNYREMERFGIRQPDAKYFLPAYEWYNDTISAWTKELGLMLVNFTPGTYSNADWTHPELGVQYLSSDTIFTRILRFERSRTDGLNGFILLTHIGTDPRRKDKFYARLDELVTALEKKGYKFRLLTDSLH